MRNATIREEKGKPTIARRAATQSLVPTGAGRSVRNNSRLSKALGTLRDYAKCLFSFKTHHPFGKSEQELGLVEEIYAQEEIQDNEENVEPASLLSLNSIETYTSLQEEESSISSQDLLTPLSESDQHQDEVSVVVSEDTAQHTKSPTQREQSWRVSRRVVLWSLGGALATAAGGGIWWMKASASQSQTVVSAGPSIALAYRYQPHPPVIINDVAWSPLGGFIASAMGGNIVQVLKATTGAVELVYRGHTGFVNSAQWAPDESRVASGSGDKTVHVWNPTTGNRLLVYEGHKSSIYYLAWSHDGTMIASAGADKIVHVWDSFTGKKISTYSGHTGSIWSLRWSPDDGSIASGGDDGIVHKWNPLTAKANPSFMYQGPRAITINEVDWSPDGRWIASAHADSHVYIWDALTGGHVLTYTGHTASARTARWAPSGKYIASGGVDDTVQIWNVLTGQHLLTYNRYTDDVLEVSWAPDGQHLASGSKDLNLQVCKVRL